MKFIFMKITTENILTVLKIIAWIAFIGFSIQCGAQIIAFVAGFFKPEWAKNMYNVDQNWFLWKEQSTWIYICMMSVIIAISAFKANIWFMIIDLLTKFKMENPFTMEVAKKLESISYQFLVISIAGTVGSSYLKGLEKYQEEIGAVHIDDESSFFFIAGVLYIISQIFKRGIEMQNENELTI